MFLPAFAFSLIFYERLEELVDNPALHHLLAGVAAAVVGVIAATLVQLGWSAAMRADRLWSAALIVLLGMIGAWRVKGRWSMPVIIGLGGGAGWALQP